MDPAPAQATQEGMTGGTVTSPTAITCHGCKEVCTGDYVDAGILYYVLLENLH